jgi:SnoaL-like domain
MSGVLTPSSNFFFLGSDGAEVIRSRREWESLMRNDWQLFESTKSGEPRNLSIQVSDDGKLASAVFEVLYVSIVDGREIESLDRFAITMRKENSDWRIVQEMTSVATVGESPAVMVFRRKTEVPKN